MGRDSPALGVGSAAVVTLLIVLFLTLLIRTAWISDDAYITFRTVDNFLHGYGLRWNVAERVQSYTHPLWMMLIAVAHFGTGEPYYATLAISAILTLIALAGIVAIADSPVAAMLGFTLVVLSKAFLDYSTSGLENPLTHALLALFWWVRWRHPDDRPAATALASSLLAITRPDTVLLVAPAVAMAVAQHRSSRWLARFALGLLPLFTWELFSLAYYGAFVPNTAHAKLLSTGLGHRELASQAVLYLRDSLSRDPVTLATIAAAVLVSARGPRRDWTVCAGILLYLLYIVRIGGDFMSGRLLTAPFLVAVLAVAHHGVPRIITVRTAAAAAIVIIAGLIPRDNLSGSSFGAGSQLRYINPSGISDERAFYYQWTGLLRVLGGSAVAGTPWALEGRSLAAGGRRVAASRSVGLVAYYAGPAVHVIDIYALADPFLARLPSVDNWRIGHFERRIPEGYLETLSSGRTAIEDEGLAEFYEKLAVVTRAPLWSRQRLATMVELNLGRYNGLLAGWKQNARTADALQLPGSIDADPRYRR